MAKKKNFWYVIVMTGEGAKFVTKVDWSHKTAEWDKVGKPLEMSEAWDKDIAFGLMANFFNAYAVCAPIELEHQPYRYADGQFEWKENDKKEGEK